MANSQQHDTALTRLLNLENATTRRGGVSRSQRYADNYAYYTGQNLPPENADQPLGINYVAAIIEKHASYLWGQWDDQRDIVLFQVDPLKLPSQQAPTDEARKLADQIRQYAQDLLRQNDGNVLLFEAGLNGGIYGDTFLKVRWDELEQATKFESVLPEYVHCRWDPQNIRKIDEIIVAYPIERAEASDKYGTLGNTGIARAAMAPAYWYGFAIYWERWTHSSFEIWIDDVNVRSVPNPYTRILDGGGTKPGIIPFVHVPNLRVAGEFYGFDDCSRCHRLQDEINRAYADQSDIINNHAHPITLVNKFFGDIKNLPVGPDVVWDMGREGEAKYLQWEGTPPQVLDYLDRVREILFDTVGMSDVAFGRHAGTQQSGMALSIEMLPVTERARWKRLLWGIGLRDLVRIAAFIESGARRGGIGFTYEDACAHQLYPKFAPILPRDRAAVVNEQVALTVNNLRGLRLALEALGVEDVDAEIAQIEELLELKQQYAIQSPGAQGYGGGPGQSQDSVTPAARKGRPEKR